MDDLMLLKLGAMLYCRDRYRSGEPPLPIGADDLITHRQHARLLPAPRLTAIKGRCAAALLCGGLDPLATQPQVNQMVGFLAHRVIDGHQGLVSKTHPEIK